MKYFNNKEVLRDMKAYWFQKYEHFFTCPVCQHAWSCITHHCYEPTTCCLECGVHFSFTDKNHRVEQLPREEEGT